MGGMEHAPLPVEISVQTFRAHRTPFLSTQTRPIHGSFMHDGGENSGRQ